MLKRIIYNFVDIITLNKGIKRNINGFNIRFSSEWSRYYEYNYEEKNFLFIKSNIQRGGVVLDIGAHIGLYSCVFSELVGREGKVLAFEPTPSTFEILKHTISLNNGFKNVQVYQKAVSDRNGEVIFNLTSHNGEGSNANSISKLKNTINSITVEVTSIDNIRREINKKIDFIKIDVEGAELLVLLGAKETFFRDKPSGTLGLHPKLIIQMGHTLEQIWDCLSQYSLLINFNGIEINKEWFCSQQDLFDVEFISR